MTRRLVLATGNPDKVREMRGLFAPLGLDVVAAREVGPTLEVVEDGSTLRENALIKARAIAAHLGELCVADDTGLEVDALGGAPGVYAARYAGPDATYADNCRKLLAEMRGRADRRARFRTVMALVDPASGVERCADGVLEGSILESPRGDRGFGYDPVFYVDELGCSLAELDLAEKNRVSHRARAARAMLELLRAHLASVGA